MRRVPSALLKRMEKVEQSRSKQRPCGGWPPIIYDIDEWSALAVVSQERLVFETREYLHTPEQAYTPPQENTQAEHERLYREYKKRVDAGAREYLNHKREQVNQATAPLPAAKEAP